MKVQLFTADPFYDFYFLRSIVLALPFRHTKTPHFLNSIPYCLTNGVQFKMSSGLFDLFVIDVLFRALIEAKHKQARASKH